MTTPEKGKEVRILQHTGCSRDIGVFEQRVRAKSHSEAAGFVLILVCKFCRSDDVIEDNKHPLPPPENSRS